MSIRDGTSSRGPRFPSRELRGRDERTKGVVDGREHASIVFVLSYPPISNPPFPHFCNHLPLSPSKRISTSLLTCLLQNPISLARRDFPRDFHSPGQKLSERTLFNGRLEFFSRRENFFFFFSRDYPTFASRRHEITRDQFTLVSNIHLAGNWRTLYADRGFAETRARCMAAREVLPSHLVQRRWCASKYLYSFFFPFPLRCSSLYRIPIHGGTVLRHCK